MKQLPELEFSQGIRCYNGAYDSESQRIINNRNTVMAEIKELIPEAHLVYFPGEEKHQVWVKNRPLTEEFSSAGAALAAAYEVASSSTHRARLA